MKNTKPEIAVGCFQNPEMEHEIEGWQKSLSITQYPNVRAITHIGPEYVAAKRNILIDRCIHDGVRYLCFLDSDARVIDPIWLDLLAQSINEDDFGAVSPIEIKSAEGLNNFGRNPMDWLGGNTNLEIASMQWIGAYCFLMDLDSGVRFDEECPGIKGMEDLIACIELWRAGRKVLLDSRTVVFHPSRVHSAESKERELEWYAQQKVYVKDKYDIDIDLLGDPDLGWKMILNGRNTER